MIKLLSGLLLINALFFYSCKDKSTPDDPIPSTGKIQINIENTVGDELLALSTKQYVNAHGDTFVVNMYKYYISNLVLVNEKNEEYKVPDSYYLIDEDKPSSKNISLKSIPAGTYKSLQFIIGVDSLRNVSGLQEGALDPANGMFWTWSTGYIMAKMEGLSPQSGSGDHSIVLHIGGFNSKWSAIQNVTLPFSENLLIQKDGQKTINIKADLNKWFEGNKIIDFATHYKLMTPNTQSSDIAKNYKNMFSIKSIF